MRESVILGCELVCVLFTLVCLIAGGLAIASHLWERIAAARRMAQDDPRPGWQFRNDIASLDRWCCWHFPIAEDIAAWLLKPDCGIDQFRARLIQKYGERNGLPLTTPSLRTPEDK